MTRHHFISDLLFWNSYLPLLYQALETTEGDVIELGMGDGSTLKLHEYCKAKGRKLYSYESNLEWYRKFEEFRTNEHSIQYIGGNWQPMIENHRQQVGVLFSDEAPGEMRKYNISMFCNIAQVVVAHDTELGSDHGYKFSLIEPLFKYKKRYEFEGADACAFSNFINVTKWDV